MAADLQNMESAKPNLEQTRMFFPVVKSIALGALLGSASVTVFESIRLKMNHKVAFKTSLASEELGHLALRSGIECAILSGFMGWASVSVRNWERSRTKPYVEKLEQERDALAAEALMGSKNTR
jgi:hypothetical protein